MIDIPLYMFANLVVTDAVSYPKNETDFFPLLKKSCGEFGTCQDQPLRMEFLTLMHSLLPGQ